MMEINRHPLAYLANHFRIKVSIRCGGRAG